jgi:hypothetical protein
MNQNQGYTASKARIKATLIDLFVNLCAVRRWTGKGHIWQKSGSSRRAPDLIAALFRGRKKDFISVTTYEESSRLCRQEIAVEARNWMNTFDLAVVIVS